MKNLKEELARKQSLKIMVRGELDIIDNDISELIKQIGHNPESEREKKLLRVVTSVTSYESAYIFNRWKSENKKFIDINVISPRFTEQMYYSEAFFSELVSLKYSIVRMDEQKIRVIDNE